MRQTVISLPRVLRTLLPLIASGCVFSPLPVDGLDCPCAAGWVCIDAVCVPTPDGYVPPPDVPMGDAPTTDDVPIVEMDVETPDAPTTELDVPPDDAGTPDDAGVPDDVP